MKTATDRKRRGPAPKPTLVEHDPESEVHSAWIPKVHPVDKWRDEVDPNADDQSVPDFDSIKE